MDRIHIFSNEKRGTISKDIYGFFVETISTLIDGIYVGEESDIPNTRGIRNDLLKKLKDINPALFRWGGCTNEVYDWRDGIGPKDKRPVTMGLCYIANGQAQKNDFGTHEFIDLCKLTGADSYITLNIASAAPLDAYRWMEYCNMPRGLTTLTQLREKNGSPEPFGVKYFGVGNENNEHGGLMSPEDYSAAYSRVASLSYSVTRNTHLIANGPTWAEVNGEWLRRFLANYDRRGKFAPWLDRRVDTGAIDAVEWCGKQMDAISMHHYALDNAADGNSATFSREQWYEALQSCMKIEKFIENWRNIILEYLPTPTTGIAVDEWGLWTTLKGGGPWDTKPMFLQTGTMREALVAALTLMSFNNNCDIVKLACLTALTNYIHSLFESRGPELIVTPTYYVFKMMKEHQNAECLRTLCASETSEGIQRVYASASQKDGKTLLTLANTCYDDPTDVVIELHNQNFNGKVEVTTLAADDPHAHNTFENPDTVKSVETGLEACGNELHMTLPPASVVCIRY